MFHYPKQFVLAGDGQLLSFRQNGSKGAAIGLTISSVEILKRRNKRKEPCTKEWKYWDDLSLKRLLEEIGCRAPYHAEHKQFPLCSTKNQMKESQYEVSNIKSKYFYPPCQGMSKIDFVYRDDDPPTEEIFSFTIEYPEQVKVITQSQAVDGHSLVGNIGGYIGLFLGLLHYQSTVLHLDIYFISIIFHTFKI